MTARVPESHQNTKSSVGVLILMPYGTYCLRQRSVLKYHGRNKMSRIYEKNIIFSFMADISFLLTFCYTYVIIYDNNKIIV